MLLQLAGDGIDTGEKLAATVRPPVALKRLEAFARALPKCLGNGNDTGPLPVGARRPDRAVGRVEPREKARFLATLPLVMRAQRVEPDVGVVEVA